MKKIIILLLFSQYIIFNLYSQCDQFTVYQSKGDNFILKKGSKEKLKIQTEIFREDKVIIGDNSNIVVISNKDKILKINEKGSYTFNNLVNKCTSIKNNLTKAYFKYVGEKLIEKENKPQTAMAIKGAVYRSEESYAENTEQYPQNSSLVENNKNIEFSWTNDNPDKKEPKKFTLYENGTKTVFEAITSENSIRIPESVILKEDALYLWKITDIKLAEDTTSALYSFIVVNKNWKEKFLNEILEMKVNFFNELNELKDKDKEGRKEIKDQYRKDIEDMKNKYQENSKQKNNK